MRHKLCHFTDCGHVCFMLFLKRTDSLMRLPQFVLLQIQLGYLQKYNKDVHIKHVMCQSIKG